MHKNVKKFSLLNFVKKSEKYRRKVNPVQNFAKTLVTDGFSDPSRAYLLHFAIHFNCTVLILF